jgi:hypothetical protein
MAGDIVYFDLETRRTANDVGGWGNKHKMGISVACTFSTKLNEYSIYTQDETAAISSSSSKARIWSSASITSASTTRYSKGTTCSLTLTDLPHSLDLLIDLEKALGHRIKLDAVAAATLGMGKTADGLDALKWWQQGEVAKIAEYCCYDVKVTKCVHEYGAKHGHVKYHDRNGREQSVKVDWKVD